MITKALNTLQSLLPAREATMRASTPQIFEAWTELWDEEPLKTEETVYRELVAVPPAKGWSHLAVPWCVLINRGWLRRIRLRPMPGPTFTVCQHIAYKSIIPMLRAAGVTRLYAAHAMGHDEGIEVLPMPLLPTHGAPPATRKDILASFVGCDHARVLDADGRWTPFGVRRRILDWKARDGFHIVERDGWHFQGGTDADAAAYRDVLSRSRFSLCPRGTGPNSIRLWESLVAGAVPIVLSDALTLPRLDGVDWSDVVLRIPERDVDSVEARIAAVSLEEETTRRALCLRLAADLLEAGNLSKVVRGDVVGTRSFSPAGPCLASTIDDSR